MCFHTWQVSRGRRYLRQNKPAEAPGECDATFWGPAGAPKGVADKTDRTAWRARADRTLKKADGILEGRSASLGVSGGVCGDSPSYSAASSVRTENSFEL